MRGHLHLVLLGLFQTSLRGQRQFQTQFQDYDYSLEQPQSPQRSRPPPPTRAPSTESTTHVAILKQINELNDDGSYTYGYEASDGTFKLETRFADGTVQGKYGYIDANGEVKIIEYGADVMGFQPEGDLPEGIVIPPPVEGNCTDCSYDYDYQEDETRQVVNRARTSNSDQSRDSARRVNQVRGQQVSQPITPPPLPRSQQQQRQQQQQQRQQQQQPQQQTPSLSFEPTPLPQSRAQPPAPAPLRSRGVAPSRSRIPAPQRQASSSSGAGFANFPARNSGGGGLSQNTPPRSRVAVPSAPARSRIPPREIPRQQQRQSQFQNFSPQKQTPNLKPAFASRPAVPSRPALTFQDPTSTPPATSPPSVIPKSALEVVDFNQLLQEFQGRSLSGGNSQFSPEPAVPPVFQTNNFPARFRL